MEIKKVKRLIKYILTTLTLISTIVWLNNYSSYSRQIGNTPFYLVETMAISKEGKPLAGLYYKPNKTSSYYGEFTPGFPMYILWNEQFLISKNFDGNNPKIIKYVIISLDSLTLDSLLTNIHTFNNKNDYFDYLKGIGLSESKMEQTNNQIGWLDTLFE